MEKLLKSMKINNSNIKPNIKILDPSYISTNPLNEWDDFNDVRFIYSDFFDKYLSGFKNLDNFKNNYVDLRFVKEYLSWQRVPIRTIERIDRICKVNRYDVVVFNMNNYIKYMEDTLINRLYDKKTIDMMIQMINEFNYFIKKIKYFNDKNISFLHHSGYISNFNNNPKFHKIDFIMSKKCNLFSGTDVENYICLYYPTKEEYFNSSFY